MFLAQVSISPDPLVYFFSHSAAFVLICAAVFFILGLLFGKFTWGRYKRQTRLLTQEADIQKNEIVTLKRKLAEMAARSGAPMPVPDGNGIRAEISGSDPVMRSFLETAAAILPAGAVDAAKRVAEPAPVPIPLSKIIAPVVEKLEKTPPLQSPAETREIKTTNVASVDSHSQPAPPTEDTAGPTGIENQGAADLIKAKMDALRALVERGKQLALPTTASHEPTSETFRVSNTEKSTESPAENHLGSDNSTQKPTMNTSPSSAEPRLHSDPYLGLIYTTPPAQSDDLTQLKGVASIIERRLNEFGVYTFKQIALWDDEHIREFSNRLSFKDRITRERWVDQARELHHQKYGVNL
jgi:predicted flap endonuclease-1-like 5' DNA nuclease